jgi:hypothetical protein
MHTLLWDLVFEESLMQKGQQNWGFFDKIAEHHWLGVSRFQVTVKVEVDGKTVLRTVAPDQVLAESDPPVVG